MSNPSVSTYEMAALDDPRAAKFFRKRSFGIRASSKRSAVLALWINSINNKG